jgi:hypothetical protein
VLLLSGGGRGRVGVRGGREKKQGIGASRICKEKERPVRPRKKRLGQHFPDSRVGIQQSENAGYRVLRGLWVSGSFQELFKATSIMESLILAQDERWRRA